MPASPPPPPPPLPPSDADDERDPLRAAADDEAGDEADGSDLPPEAREALEALFSEPFPARPWALVAGGDSNPEYRDYVIHHDIDTERQCVFLFDSIVDAFRVAEEYKQATEREAEPVEVDIYGLDEERFWVKFYRATGVAAILSLPDYKEHVGSRYEE